MNYIYTAENRLETPHTYAYAEFGGEEFLAAYVRDRRRSTARIGQVIREMEFDDVARLLRDELAASGGMPSSGDALAALHALELDQTVDTARLLDCLLDAHLADVREPVVARWLDRLIQRFEVSKRLYARYRPGFRKGDGDAGHAQPYLMLATILCLNYGANRRLNHLSTLLKLADLLCSLPATVYAARQAVNLGLIINAEVAAVRMLANSKRLHLAA